MAVNLQVNVDASAAEEGFQKVAAAATNAADIVENIGQSGADGLDQLPGRIRQLREEVNALSEEQHAFAVDAVQNTEAVELATRELEAAEKDVAAAAEERKKHAAEAAKELAEGLSKAAETYIRTGDMTDAALDFSEGAAKAVLAFNPIAGIVATAAINMTRLAKLAWDSAEAARAEAEQRRKVQIAQEAADRVGKRVAESMQLSNDVLAGYDAAKAKIEAINSTVDTLVEAQKDVQLLQSQMAPTDIEGRMAAARKYNELEAEIHKLLEQEAIARQARSLTYAKKQEELEKERAARIRQINAELERVEGLGVKEAEREKLSRQELHQLYIAKRDELAKANGEEEKSAEILKEIEALKRGMLKIDREAASAAKAKSESSEKEAQDARERAREVEAEISRINGLDAEAARRERQTRGDLVKVMQTAQGKLEDQNLTQEEQNKLLREMEDAKRRIMAMDKEAADAERHRLEDARKANDEARKRFAETDQGRQAMAAAASPEAIARRLASDTGRKVGTVRQMMARGDISQEDLAHAAERNFQDAINGSVQATQQSVGLSRDMAAAMERVIGEQSNLGTEMADVRQQVRSLWRSLDSNAEAGHRRRARVNSA